MSAEIYQPTEQPDKDTPTTQNIRSSYAALLQDGHTLEPKDFHDAYHNAGFDANPDLQTSLPSNEELTDHALEALRRSSMPISPDTVHNTRKNVLDHYATTGNLPDLSDGSTADAITREWRYTPTIQANMRDMVSQLAGTVQKLETGGLKDPDHAVSTAGARGRNQIMPDTARQYGFDPDRLFDANYNNMVRDTI